MNICRFYVWSNLTKTQIRPTYICWSHSLVLCGQIFGQIFGNMTNGVIVRWGLACVVVAVCDIMLFTPHLEWLRHFLSLIVVMFFFFFIYTILFLLNFKRNEKKKNSSTDHTFEILLFISFWYPVSTEILVVILLLNFLVLFFLLDTTYSIISCRYLFVFFLSLYLYSVLLKGLAKVKPLQSLSAVGVV